MGFFTTAQYAMNWAVSQRVYPTDSKCAVDEMVAAHPGNLDSRSLLDSGVTFAGLYRTMRTRFL